MSGTDTKISALAPADELSLDHLLPIVQPGGSRRATLEQVLDLFRGASLSPVALTSFTTITSNHVATSFSFLALDTSGGSFNLTLPEGGGPVTLRDPTGHWEINPPTIIGNGRTIDGDPTLLANLTGFDLEFASFGSVWRYSLKPMYGG